MPQLTAVSFDGGGGVAAGAGAAHAHCFMSTFICVGVSGEQTRDSVQVSWILVQQPQVADKVQPIIIEILSIR